MAKYSDAQKEPTAHNNKKAYNRIDVVVPKGQLEIIKAFTVKQGKNLNYFICDAIEYQMKQSEQHKE